MTADFDVPIKQARRDDLERTRTMLREWLAARLPNITDLRILDIQVPEASGVANETLLVDARWCTDGTAVDDGVVVRIASTDPLYLDADIEVHALMYENIGAAASGPPVPRVIGYEPDPAVLGAPFFVMQRIHGQVPSDSPHYTEAGFVKEASEVERRHMWDDAVGALAALHRIDSKRFRFLERPRDGATGLEQDLAAWSRYLEWADPQKTNDLLWTALHKLRATMPQPAPTALSWGDARIGNMIFRDFRCVAVLDWDTVSLAGPVADVAWWIFMEHTASNALPGFGTPDELVDRWEDLTGLRATNLAWHLAFAAFRVSAIMVRLLLQMGASGQLPKDIADEQSQNGDSIQQLALLLGIPAPGPITANLPKLRRL